MPNEVPEWGKAMGMMLRRRHETNKSNSQSKGVTTLQDVTPKPVEDKKAVSEPEAKKNKVTRNDIMKMNVAQVRAYAETQGFKGANAMSGAELKRQLVDKMFEEDSEDEE